MSAPYQAFTASDGMFVIGAANEKLWKLFCGVIERKDLLEDPRFANNKGRVANREALVEELGQVFAHKSVAEWVDLLLGAGIPAGPINDFQQCSTPITRSRARWSWRSITPSRASSNRSDSPSNFRARRRRCGWRRRCSASISMRS
jgi:crotonobetainyl-CoA:carnitine CoA-transferase CaiB-like acyl-CoA transferase